MKKIGLLFLGAACAFATGCSHIPGGSLAQNLRPSSGLEPTPSSKVMTKIMLDGDACWPEAEIIQSYQLSEVVDLWDRVREGFALPQHDNKRVQQQLRWYAQHPDYMERVTQRGLPYLYHIVEELQARNMPTEFALLPIVESAFDPFAYSHGRASGMWQFVPGTGKYLGLEQNWWYDGRRDITASTDAALRYLDRLSQAFDGDWLLALAAYNGGRGNVSKAIRRNKALGKPTDFWSLDLPKETEAYVPRLLALKHLVQDPARFNVSLISVPNEPFFTVIDVGSQIDLAQAAELAEMSMDDFYLLNPGFNRWATAPEGPHRLVVPLEKAEIFQTNLAAIPADQRVTWDRYRIKSGDSLSSIAAQYNTSIGALKAVNGLRGNRIRQGDVLMVPVAAKDVAHYTFSADQRLEKTQASNRNTGASKVTYQVQSGDSFWTISRRYKVSVKDVAKWNGMAPGDPLKIGQELVIWTQQAEQNTVATQGVVRKVAYKVRKGDSLAKIASRFRVTVQDIQSWNKLNPSAYLQPGQALTLFVDVTQH